MAGWAEPRWSGCIAISVAVAFGCSGSTPENSSDGLILEESDHEGPAELVLGGKRYLRLSSLTQRQTEELSDPELWEQPETLDKLAQLLRAYVGHPQYGAYVEAEPNYELARVSLGRDAAAPAKSPPLAASRFSVKTISPNGDQRVKAPAPTGYPSYAFALFEGGGSGTNLGDRIYTAAHVLYNNAFVPGANGWRCANGFSGSCGTNNIGRWRFGGRIDVDSNGVETQTWASGWSGTCGVFAVTNAWINLPTSSSGTTVARWDYGLKVLSGCMPTGAGGVGWWTTNQATLRGLQMWEGGYPGLFPCPALAIGTPTDCPNGTSQLRTAGLSLNSAGSLFWTSAGVDSTLVATGGYMQSTKMDITPGQSGGGVIVFDPSDGFYWVVGTTSNSVLGQTGNNFNHLTSEVQGFLYSF